ncbi:DNA cytosine methyltransferase [Kibdelosporangium aridum]|uniref:DNA (cytosine-5-)-methyltransferase n=1 Tax=Kibdelosporangium aridum TaxID=2030 RepID=A0A1W2DNA4_KIBAR|nr:DNA cytosine methyltransferase [Kibdelosporangium aridum]SMC98974.1 DNA (cytosine-5)-methyltransferase 1 [Kibdelosporangium aridum]
MITVTDLFCGAGGSSSGAESVPGVRVVMAANHWDLAIETHQTNFPHVDHDRQDIAQVDPGRFPRTDVLWASPACTFWSIARGERQDFADQPTDPTLFDLDTPDDTEDEPLPDEARERSRALMQDVPRFAEHHRYRAVIVENTPPLLKWRHFSKWIARMRNAGYEHKVLTLNSAFAHQLGAPAPQLRDRVYVVFWQKRYRAPDFDRWTRPRAWCPSCDQTVTALHAPKNPKKPYGAYGRQYVYRCPAVACRGTEVAPYVLPALAALDLSVRGERIGDRKEALSPKTTARIEAWLSRFTHAPKGRDTVEELRVMPALVPVEGRENKNAAPVMAPARTQTGRHETALLVPAGGTWNDTAQTADVPMRTRTTRESDAVVVVPLRNNNRVKTTLDPLDTFAAGGNHHALAMVIRNNTPRGNPGQMCTPVGEPLRTLTTAGHQSLVTWDPNMLYAYDTGRMRGVDSPMPTQTTVEGDAVLRTAPSIEDCLFRMLLVEEIKLGMAFPTGFVLLGTSKRVKVRMCGNAVTPPVSRDLWAAVVEAITRDDVTPPIDTTPGVAA